MSRIITVFGIAIALLFLLSGQEFQDSAGLDVTTVQEFGRLDRDRDGKLSIREFAFTEVAERFELAGKGKSIPDVFKAIDQNVDGGVNLVELVQSTHNRNARVMERNISRAFLILDTDLDGLIALEEYQVKKNANLDLFGRIDLNDNQKIGAFEWLQELKLSKLEKAQALDFAKLDQNDDSAISLEEYRTGNPPAWMANTFEAIDLNGNREIGFNEYAKAISLPEGQLTLAPEHLKHFESIDRNRDHRISSREFDRFDPPEHPPGKGHPEHPPGKGPPPRHVKQMIFRQIDTDNDQEISISEFGASHLCKPPWEEPKANR